MLAPQTYYHIYNRANGFENLFVNEGNYNFFLEKIKHHLAPILNIHAYCLMPNHFHLLVKIKSEEEIISVIENQTPNYKESRTYLKFDTLDKFVSYFISKQFSNLFSSYTQAFNKQQKRTGSLFQKGFKRKEVASNDYLKELVLYIHCNPVHHRFVEDFKRWKHISYHRMIKEPTNHKVVNWFDDLANFIACHQDKNEFNKIENILLE